MTRFAFLWEKNLWRVYIVKNLRYFLTLHLRHWVREWKPTHASSVGVGIVIKCFVAPKIFKSKVGPGQEHHFLKRMLFLFIKRKIRKFSRNTGRCIGKSSICFFSCFRVKQTNFQQSSQQLKIVLSLSGLS